MNNDYIPQPLNFTELSEPEMEAKAAEFYQQIKTRRSIRDFSDKKVPDSVIQHALLAAGTAPNGANMQPWHFVVVSNPAVKKQIREAAEEEEREFYSEKAPEDWLDALSPLGTDADKPFLERASHLIVIFLQKFTYDEDGNKLKHYYTSESVGIASGFLISALHQAGVATLTHTPSPMKFLNQILKRPKDERPYMILVAGYPEKDCMVPSIEKKPLEQFATFID
ncbi:nitroreductase family protein [Reinekea sp.]|jgi:iodotyrosine deiodinase|uniref:nitroreductase family protein n=1 Tax=Reinekea sp. TaxID=1970455 RepID=UPI00398A3FDD